MIEYEEIRTEESNAIKRIPIREVEDTERAYKINRIIKSETKERLNRFCCNLQYPPGKKTENPL